MDYDAFDILSGKFSRTEAHDNFVEDLQIAQAEYAIVKAILEHHLNQGKRESGDLE